MTQRKRIPSDSEELSKATKSYAELVQIYPDNEDYLRYYAELLLASNQQTAALEALQRLYTLLDKHSPKTAKALVAEYPQLGHVNQHETQEDNHDIYQSLYDAFGGLWLRLHQKKFKEGEPLYQQGEHGDTLTLILSGEVAIYTKQSDGKPVLLNIVKQDNFVGEGCFLNPGSRTASIVANCDSKVVELPRKKLLGWLMERPRITTMLERNADYRHMICILSNNDVLKILPMSMRQHLAYKAKLISYAAKQIIHQAGNALDGVEIIVEGDVFYVRTTSKGKLVKLGDVACGELLGDTSAVKKATCPADMFTASNVTIAHIPIKAFETVIAAYPPLKEKLMRHADHQRMEIMQMVSQGRNK